MFNKIHLGILGLGTVGSGVVRILQEKPRIFIQTHKVRL